MDASPAKSYNNIAFLNSPAARPIRLLCEYEEARQRLLEHRVHHTVVFFGSSRVTSHDYALDQVHRATDALRARPSDATLTQALERANQLLRNAAYYEQSRELAYRLTTWSMQRQGGRAYYVCSGGGPGIMEAANRGAHEAKGRSVGLGISLPFEQGMNNYVTPELAFEFHYFFMRKYWFFAPCRAVVFFPGGYGTLDELCEALTLVQTGKIKRRLPMVLFGSAYWDRLLNLEVAAEMGMINPGDPQLVHRVDTVDQAFRYLTEQLEAIET